MESQNKTALHYNCLGWELSEKKWLHLHNKMFDNPSISVALKKEANAFLRLHLEKDDRKLFDETSQVSSFANPSYQLKKQGDDAIKDGTIALYFEDAVKGAVQWSHASKYNERVKHYDKIVELNSWSSKQGASDLVTHPTAEDIKCIYKKTSQMLFVEPMSYLHEVEEVAKEVSRNENSDDL
jgi:hypothetical protein